MTKPRARQPRNKPQATLTRAHTSAHTRPGPEVRTGTNDRIRQHIPEARAAYDAPAVTEAGAIVRPVGYVRLMHVRQDQKEAYEQRATVTPSGELRVVWVRRDAPMTPNQHAAHDLLARARRAMR